MIVPGPEHARDRPGGGVGAPDVPKVLYDGQAGHAHKDLLVHVGAVVLVPAVDERLGSLVEERQHLLRRVDGPDREGGRVARQLHKVDFEGLAVRLDHLEEPRLVQRAVCARLLLVPAPGQLVVRRQHGCQRQRGEARRGRGGREGAVAASQTGRRGGCSSGRDRRTGAFRSVQSSDAVTRSWCLGVGSMALRHKAMHPFCGCLCLTSLWWGTESIRYVELRPAEIGDWLCRRARWVTVVWHAHHNGMVSVEEICDDASMCRMATVVVRLLVMSGRDMMGGSGAFAMW